MNETPKVEQGGGLAWIRGSGLCRDWNGIHYKLGMSGKNVGATQLSMNVAVIPPGGVAAAHIHVGFEVMLYILEGRVRHEYRGRPATERRTHGRRFHLHRARRSARGVQREQLSIRSSPSSRDRAPTSGIASCRTSAHAQARGLTSRIATGIS